MRAKSPSRKRSVGPGMLPLMVNPRTDLPAGLTDCSAMVRSYSTTRCPAAGRMALHASQEKAVIGTAKTTKAKGKHFIKQESRWRSKRKPKPTNAKLPAGTAMRGHNASVKDADSIQERVIKHPQADRRVGPVACDGRNPQVRINPSVGPQGCGLHGKADPCRHHLPLRSSRRSEGS